MVPFVSAECAAVVVVVVVAGASGVGSTTGDCGGLVPTATFFTPDDGETAVVVDFFATPFCCSFLTNGEVAVAFGASEVRVVVVVLAPTVLVEEVVFVTVCLTSSVFLGAAVLVLDFEANPVPVGLVAAPVRGTVVLLVVEVLVFVVLVAPSVVVVPLVSVFFAATGFFAVVEVVVAVFEGTDVPDTALDGREVTVRVVVLVVDKREVVFAAALVVVPAELGLDGAVLVVELALAALTVLDDVSEVAFGRVAAAADVEVVVGLLGAVFAPSVVGFFAAIVGLLDVALDGRVSFTPFVVGFGAAVVVGADFLATVTGGLRAATVVLLLLTRLVVLFAAASLAPADDGFAVALDAVGFFAAEADAGAFGLVVLLVAVTAAATAAVAATAVAAATAPATGSILTALASSATTSVADCCSSTLDSTVT